MKTLYKVLDKDNKSPFKGYLYPIGEWQHCSDFDEDRTHICSKGFYATGIEGTTYAFSKDMNMWEVEVKGRFVEFDVYKRRYEYMKVIRKLDNDEIVKLAKAKEKELGYKLSEILFSDNPFSRIRENPNKRRLRHNKYYCLKNFLIGGRRDGWIY